MPEQDERSRGQRVADWVGWHLVELLAVGVPAVLALTIAAWLIAISVIAGGAWATAEVRAARRHRAELHADQRAELTSDEHQDDEHDQAGADERHDESGVAR